jgi:hypothetical protein
MSVLLPWNRNKAVNKGTAGDGVHANRGVRNKTKPRTRALGPLLKAIAVVAAGSAVFGLIRYWPVPVETVWEAPGKRLVAARDGHYLVSVDGSYSVIDGAGVDRQIGTTAGTPALGPDGSVAIMDLPQDERVVAALDDGTREARRRAARSISARRASDQKAGSRPSHSRKRFRYTRRT